MSTQSKKTKLTSAQIEDEKIKALLFDCLHNAYRIGQWHGYTDKRRGGSMDSNKESWWDKMSVIQLGIVIGAVQEQLKKILSDGDEL